VTVPVVLVIFNRPETTKRVFAEIRRYQPERLLVIADGPRGNRDGEAERCAATRRIVDQGVDWPCKIERCWSDTNLGCRKRVSSGLTWAFTRAESAIILEDDCLPDPSFFPYCEALLARYATDERIGSIGACNFLGRRHPRLDSYRFSRFSHVWGWASWSRAWDRYDVDMKAWPGLRNSSWLKGECGDPTEEDFWRSVFDGVADGRIDTWDFQWTFANWANRMASIVPSVNLVANIGFGADATHTTATTSWGTIPTMAIELELRHPTVIAIDHGADREVAQAQYHRSWKRRLWDRWRNRT